MYFAMWSPCGTLFLLSLSAQSVISANILHLAVIPSPSHHIWNRALAFGLAHAGHNVTYVGADSDNLPKPQNYTHILLEGIYDDMDDNFDINGMANYGSLRIMKEFQDWCIMSCELTLNTKGFQKLLNYPEDFKFDLIIIDVTAGTCFYPFIHRFNYPPTVGVTPFLLPSYVSYNFGNHLFPSFIPWYGLRYTTEMSFMERLWNFLFTYMDVTWKHLRQYEAEQETAKKHFGKNIPSMIEIERHISLILANTDPILDYPQPLPPNIIAVGGLHAKKAKEIPPEFRNILDNAKDGVILFSLGTNIRSDKLGKDTIKAILSAFAKMRQTVIWKFESDLDNLPKNVIVRKWLPQNDILGHPNVKLFIGHGGALSTQEAIYHGVPIAAVPFVVDQYVNAKMIVNKQLGVFVDQELITTNYFLNMLKEVLDNPIYTENAKKFSQMYNDRKETPLERAIFWVEYVLRHGGAQFLNTAARDLPFYKSLGIDVIGFLLSVIFIAIVILYKILRSILKLFSSKKKIKQH